MSQSTEPRPQQPSLLPAYLRQMARWKLLTRDEEREIAQRLASTRAALIELLEETFGREAPGGDWTDPDLADACRAVERETSTSRPKSDKLRRLRGRFERLRTRLVQHNLRLVIHLAKRQARSDLSLMDLIQEGNIGLMKAVERFDPSRDCRFSTYAYWWIKQAMDRAAVNQGSMIRIPAQVNADIRRVRRAMNDSLDTDGSSPSRAETARRLGLDVAEVERLLRVSRETSRAPVVEGEDDAWDPLDTLTDDGRSSPQRPLLEREQQGAVRAMLDELSTREREIVCRRFGIGHRPRAQTLADIAADVGLSRERVRQLLLRARKKVAATETARQLRGARPVRYALDELASHG